MSFFKGRATRFGTPGRSSWSGRPSVGTRSEDVGEQALMRGLDTAGPILRLWAIPVLRRASARSWPQSECRIFPCRRPRARHWARRGASSARGHGAAGDVPHERRHLSRDCRGDDGRFLAALAELAISGRQARLRLLRNVLNLQRLLSEDVELPLAWLCLQAVSLSPLDQIVPHAGVARAGDAAAPGRLAGRVFARHEPEIGHQRHRCLDPPHIADLGQSILT